jgi:hypothetical protein
MTQEPQYGAGLWHFAQYVDRYATDGYGPPVTTLEAIDLAGKVGDLAVVDITYPFNPPGLPVSQVAEALGRNSLRAIGITPESSAGARSPTPTRGPARGPSTWSARPSASRGSSGVTT